MAGSTDPGDCGAYWRLVGLGALLVTAIAGAAGLRGRGGAGRPLRRAGIGSLLLGLACWCEWLAGRASW